VSFVGNASESELAMEDLHALLGQLELAPAVIGGTSFGCGVSLLLAIRHPEDVKALLLWGPGGGSDASTRFIGGLMYGQFIEVAQRGGMEAVAETPFFKERIAANAANRDRLLSTDVSLFMKTMARWMKDNEAGARLFVAPNTTEEQVEAIRAPAIVVPGNDDTHTPEVGARLHAMLPGSKIAHHPAPPAFEAGDRDAMAQHQREFASGLAPVFASYLAELGI
jgi:pimeloyl-ACP methyl ester carboxylesterase